MSHALIVDDDVDFATTLRELIVGASFTVAIAHSLRDARRQIALQRPNLVLLDVRLPDGNGLDLFSDPQLVTDSDVVLITGNASLETSTQALRMGAVDYIVKPINQRQLQGVLSRVMKPATLKAEVQDLAADVTGAGRFGHLWGRAAAMQRVYEQISRVAATGVTVLVTGESGSGKELVAQTVHDLSRRRRQTFLAVNCGAISPNLIESEIFGHEKGSFTGAERQHLGFFERANGGTLFLDEITEMPLELQVKLLRVLDTGRYMRVGSSQALEADVRVIAATNRVPMQAVAQGRLREDLLYRLNVFPIQLPPLRERMSDLPLLAQQFLLEIAHKEGGSKRFTPHALEHLQTHDWPGNVRELRNAVQRAYIMSSGELINEQWLPPSTRLSASTNPIDLATSVENGLAPPGAQAPARNVQHPVGAPQLTLPMGISMAAAKRALILATFEHFGQHQEHTAAVLGISLKTLYNRLKEYRSDAPP